MTKAGLQKPADLARKLDVHRQTVSKWLNGDVDDLSPEMLFKLADALEVNARWLYTGPPASPIKPRVLDPEDEELVQIKETLDRTSPDAKEQWLSNGRSLVRIVTPASRANPFPAKPKVKKS
jgi:transcriptional regulator with XRE-family HTH domain